MILAQSVIMYHLILCLMFQNLGLEEAGVKMTKNGAIEVCFSFFNPLIILSTFGSFCRLRAVRMEERNLL